MILGCFDYDMNLTVVSPYYCCCGTDRRRLVHRVPTAVVIVFDAARALLLLGKRDVEVELEVAADRGRPGKRPPHPAACKLESSPAAPATRTTASRRGGPGESRSRCSRPRSSSRLHRPPCSQARTCSDRR